MLTHEHHQQPSSFKTKQHNIHFNAENSHQVTAHANKEADLQTSIAPLQNKYKI